MIPFLVCVGIWLVIGLLVGQIKLFYILFAIVWSGCFIYLAVDTGELWIALPAIPVAFPVLFMIGEDW